PEVQCRMCLEGRAHEHDLPTDGIGRNPPFERFFGVRKHGMNALAHSLQNRPGERLRLLDIGVDAGVAAHNMPPPSIRRTTPMTITSRLRLRPAVPRESIPTAAPMIASGMMSQLAQPSSGRNVMRVQISAMKPMISDAMLNISSA